jgi:peptidylprolyl isomerase
MRRPLRVLLLLLLAACASGATPEAATVTAPVAFAPTLSVDLAAMTRRPSGLYLRDLDAGAGEEAARGRRVTVRYTGWLPDGTAFDGTEGGGGPVTFRLGAGTAIRGWEEGLIGLREGGRRQLVVPPRLAYGGRGLAGKVPPDATLVFVIELVSVR